MTVSDVSANTVYSSRSHFTGKERDAESGNDYFEARYYSSAMGRFMSPDWAAKASPVPYATFGDPQSLNLYAYMRNNPLGGADPDGHCDISCQFSIVMGIANGIRRDGSVGAYAKNVGTGILKGAGSTAVNAVNMANAGTNPGAIAAAVLSPGPAALQPSNTTQAQASIATQIVLPAVAGMGAGAALQGAAAAEVPEVLTEGTIFRSGGTNPANLTGEDLSFRNSLSNLIDSGNSPVFSPGKGYFGVDVSKLPEGSAVLDNNPAGHVNVNAPAQDIKNAVVIKDKFPK